MQLRTEVHERLGSAVHHLEDRPGGFSWGVLGVAHLASGEQVFIKAVHSDTGNAQDYRTEAAIAAALPAAMPTPRLRFSIERTGWLLLCFDVAPGTLPREPWQSSELEAALAMLTACARALTPSPVTGVPTLADRLAGRSETWQGLDRDGVYDVVDVKSVGPWARAHLHRLAEAERRWPDLVTGDTLLHFDPRFDNIVIDAYGTARLVDWGRDCTGPAWADLVGLLMQSDLGDRDPQHLFEQHPLGRDTDPERVDGFLVALAGYWTHTAALPGPPHAPHLRTRREYSRKATMSWLQSRWKPRGG